MNQQLEATVAERTAELEELVAIKDRFVAMVSHELRTPLTSISGFSLTMERLWDALPDLQKRNFVEIIGRQSERLGRLVEDLLTLSKLRSSTFQLREVRLDVREAVEQAISDLGAHEVSVDVEDGLSVSADRDYVQQMLVNYLANALKYGKAPIAVTARSADDRVVIRVADNGQGVPAAFVPLLFDEYARRLIDDAADPQPGTGLGLAIVRQLAEAHGGTAWYEPNEPHGAVFAISLPAAS